MFSVSALLEALLLVTALSLDAFASSFAYGAAQIKIPGRSLLVINLICSGSLALALLLGGFLHRILPAGLGSGLCFLLLLCLGTVKIFDSALKALIRRQGGFQKKIHFSLASLGFILKIYANPEEADLDRSHILTAGEAAALALALSLDGVAVGFGAGLAASTSLLVILLSLVSDTLALTLGCRLGRRCQSLFRRDFSWLGGALLIVLAILKLP